MGGGPPTSLFTSYLAHEKRVSWNTSTETLGGADSGEFCVNLRWDHGAENRCITMLPVL
jgi:hypothetical protein